jgi:multiple antibiotic resistance protein
LPDEEYTVGDQGEQGWLAYLALIVSLFAIMNPLYSISTFLLLSQDLPAQERRAIPRRTALAAFVIMVIAFFAGEPILRIFSVSLPALRIAGGAVVFATGWSMVRGDLARAARSHQDRGNVGRGLSIAIIPLAMPLTAGPGAMSLMIVVATYPNPWEGKVAIVVAVLLVCLTVWLTLRLADRISSVLGATGMDVVGRIMGLILLALSVEFITTGLMEKFPGLL